MSFKIVIFAAAVFAYEANAQMGGMIRPFTTGFASGFNDVAKPVPPFGEPVRPPVGEYVPRVPQMMPYPAQYVPGIPGGFDRFEPFGSGMTGANYFQAMVPPGNFKPQAQFYQIQGQYMKPPPPPPPFPPRPAVGETFDKYRPSTLLIQPPVEVPKPEVPSTLEAQFEVPKPEKPATLDAEFEIPTVQRPLPIEDLQ